LFFEDFEKQDYWLMTKKTSIHINIGINKENVDWNITKGAILLKDWKKDDEDDLPFTFYDIPDRVESGFNTSFLNRLTDTTDWKKVKLDNIKEIEKLFESLFWYLYEEHGDKCFGFNIKHIEKHNYVEFRYVGGTLDYDIMKEKTLYFAHIVYAMTNYEYKRKDYLKKLYKYVDWLKDEYKKLNENINRDEEWEEITGGYDVYQLMELLNFKYGKDVFKDINKQLDEYEEDYNPDHFYEEIRYELEQANLFNDFTSNWEE
jgi:hypothetical protein